MKKNGILFVFCDGTNHDLKDGSIVARYYELLQANSIDIKAATEEKINSIKDFEPGEIYFPDYKNNFIHYKIYIPGPGSATRTPGKDSPVLAMNKKVLVKPIEKQRKLKKSLFFKSFYGLDTATIDNSYQRIIKGLVNGEGRVDNVHKVCAIITTLLFESCDEKAKNSTIKTNQLQDFEIDYDNLILVEEDVEEDHKNPEPEIKNEDNDKLAEIVLVGWSRGAITASHIRCKLHEIGIEIPISLFLIDPVAGRDIGLIDQETKNYVPSKVDVRLYAYGSKTREFHPQSLERLSSDFAVPNYRIKAYPVYGTHSQVAGSPQKNSTYVTSVPAMITEKLLIEFFKDAIGEEESTLLLGEKYYEHGYHPEKCIGLYAYTQANTDLYEDQSPKLFSLDKFYIQEIRPFLTKLDQYLPHPQFFVNLDHETKFAKYFGDLYTQIDKLNEDNINVIFETKGLDQCSKTVLTTSILCKDLDEKIRKIPADKIFAVYRELVASLRKEIQEGIYEQIKSNKTIVTITNFQNYISVIEYITKILFDYIPVTISNKEDSQQSKKDIATTTDLLNAIKKTPLLEDSVTTSRCDWRPTIKVVKPSKQIEHSLFSSRQEAICKLADEAIKVTAKVRSLGSNESSS